MSVQVVVRCDGHACRGWFELNNNGSSDVEVEHHGIAENGWLIDLDNGFDYCPKCATKIKEEEEQGND